MLCCDDAAATGPAEAAVTACPVCGVRMPVGHLQVAGEDLALAALPLILEHFRADGRPVSEPTAAELLGVVKVYNRVTPAQEPALRAALLATYAAFCGCARAEP